MQAPAGSQSTAATARSELSRHMVNQTLPGRVHHWSTIAMTAACIERTRKEDRKTPGAIVVRTEPRRISRDAPTKTGRASLMSSRRVIAEHRRAALRRGARMLVLRTLMVSMAAFAVPFGFLAGIRASASTYDPHLFAVGISALFGAACGAIVFLTSRHRMMKAELCEANDRIEALSDTNWELRESEDRARSLLDAQGDLIVRRGAEGRITYVNDTFCALAGEAHE